VKKDTLKYALRSVMKIPNGISDEPEKTEMMKTVADVLIAIENGRLDPTDQVMETLTARRWSCP